MNYFSENLKELRKKKHLSQQDLADKSGLSKRVISYYESEEENNFLDKAEKIAKALDVSIADLLIPPGLTKTDNSDNIFKNIDVRTLKKLELLLSLSKQKRSIVYKFVESLLTNPDKDQD